MESRGHGNYGFVRWLVLAAPVLIVALTIAVAILAIT